MSYQVLARKYRSAGFDDLIGQDAIATTADDLGDDPSGTAPRVGAPTWTGTRLGQFRTLGGSMADALDGATLDVMIELMVRDLSNVIGGN